METSKSSTGESKLLKTKSKTKGKMKGKAKNEEKNKTVRKTSKSAQASKSSPKETNAKKAPAQKRATLSRPKKAAASKAKDAIDETMMTINEEQRRKMIAESAYLLAEKRCFKDGDCIKDWLLAEAEVDTLIRNAPDNKTIT